MCNHMPLGWGWEGAKRKGGQRKDLKEKGNHIGRSGPRITRRWARRERWLSGCGLCGCGDKRGDLGQRCRQVIEFDRGSNGITAQRGETKVFGVVGREI